ncbi:unnamed protein product [Periconia digitata]|uniref:Uncharacterized protein n=1 Tax=Periconia digitata TaxID=1303443 RepID=A0A9W4XTG5_9PLEO|nr:unnamed protein product [Periconia digitata]
MDDQTARLQQGCVGGGENLASTSQRCNHLSSLLSESALHRYPYRSSLVVPSFPSTGTERGLRNKHSIRIMETDCLLPNRRMQVRRTADQIPQHRHCVTIHVCWICPLRSSQCL